MSDLDGAVAVVTGASKGIGRATAQMLSAEGAKVVLVARGDDVAQLGRELAQTGPEPVCVQADVRKQSDIDELLKTTLDSAGVPDILVANAGVGLYAPITETSMDDFDDILATN